LTYAAAIRGQALDEMEWTPLSIEPMDSYRCVAYGTPSWTTLKE